MRGCQNLTRDRSIPMTDQAISPLRRRMIEDMTIRKLAPKTQQGYIRNVRAFAAFLGRPPDTASREDVRRYQLHLASSGAGTPKINSAVSALRFFFDMTLDRAALRRGKPHDDAHGDRHAGPARPVAASDRRPARAQHARASAGQ